MSIRQSLYIAYREVAKKFIRQPQAEGIFKVSEYAAVIPTEDGAFVEVMLWIPRNIAEAYEANPAAAIDPK